MTNWYQRHSVLLLDDLGAESAKDWAVERLTALVDERLRLGKRMVLATNLTQAQALERLGDRLTSRVFQTNQELGDVTLVAIVATDYRGRRP